MPSFREVAAMLRTFVRAIDTGQLPVKGGVLMANARRMIADLDAKRADETPWTAFQPSTAVPMSKERLQLVTRALGLSEAEATDAHGRATGPEATLWVNSRYQVIVQRNTESGMVWLSIKRHDQQAIRNWRDLQRIKNELVGPECEGVELFPATSRCVDQANQYHLWVAPEPEFRFPLGFATRMVTDDVGIGEAQEPIEPGVI